MMVAAAEDKDAVAVEKEDKDMVAATENDNNGCSGRQ
jgi:hypothetical protein